MSAYVRARGVTVRAGRATLVDRVDLEIERGEIVALVGPNGAGKSTLLGALAGDRPLAAGSAFLGDLAVHRAPAAALARRRAILPQRSPLAAAFTALGVVQLGQLGAADPAAARAHLASVELGALADRAYPTLSGGEQQRVQLARVLAQLASAGAAGAALFLDEPTSALDLRHQRLVLQLARRTAEAGHAVAIVLHDLALAARAADRIALLARGRLVADGAPGDVVTRDVLSAAYETDVSVSRTNDGGIAVTAL